MPIEWRDTLGKLSIQFESQASRSTGLHHLLVEVADHERDKMVGPNWFHPFSSNIPIVSGSPQYSKWDCLTSEGLPWVSPSFREVKSNETFAEGDTQVIRDKSGVPRAVAIPMKLRQGYFCGQSYETVSSFKSLADAAAIALTGAADLNEHVFASDLVDIFHKPRGGVRYVFGEISSAPAHFIARGWNPGILQFNDGVLIDLPIAESSPNARNWLLLLHRLGWHRITGSALRSQRTAWEANVEVALEMLTLDRSSLPEGFGRNFESISAESFYSVLGTQDAPLDINLASALAIQLLLADLNENTSVCQIESEYNVSYSDEEWKIREVPNIREVKYDECKVSSEPKVGIFVATEVERLAVLKKMRPPKNKRALLQVYSGNNTCFVGRLGVTDVVVCMTAMGSIGRDASMMVAAELIEAWNLAATIMVGIAFGKDATKQEIGTVLVSDRIVSYEPERVGASETQERGSQHMAGTVLLNRFRNVVGWVFRGPNGRPCGFQVGPVLSGEKLVDKTDFKRRLFERFPTAIGGEMEGAGLAAAAERKRCEWIVVKAICDWGDGTKSKLHQEFAAASSVNLVEHVLNQVSALDSLNRPDSGL